MRLLKICMFFFGINFMILSCVETSHNEQDPIISQTLDSVMNFMFLDFDPEVNYKLIHFERYPDKTKLFSVEQNILRNPQGNYETIMKKLVNNLNDSVAYRFEDYQYKNITITESDIFDDNSFFEDPDFYGLISISDSVVDGKYGCYYLAIECGEDCGQGILVRVKSEKGGWRVDRISNLWTAN